MDALRLPPGLENRETSGFPLSIGTGLALETLFEPQEDSLSETAVEQTVDLTKYSTYAFNVGTLLRNILGSVKGQDAVSIQGKYYLYVLIEEITFLEEFFQEKGLNIAFYINSYTFFKKNYKDKLRKSSTDKQYAIDAITDFCLGKVIKTKQNIQTFVQELTFPKRTSVLVLTHIPADLLSYGRFSTLDLLESHTGTIKTRRHWNTKYFKVPGKDMSFLPFMEYLLVNFGDSVMFKPAPIKERLAIYEQLEKKGVNPLTSEMSFGFLLK